MKRRLSLPLSLGTALLAFASLSRSSEAVDGLPPSVEPPGTRLSPPRTAIRLMDDLPVELWVDLPLEPVVSTDEHLTEVRGSLLDPLPFELEPRVSVLAFSSNFKSSVRVGGGLRGRVPLAWLSHDLFSWGEDTVGLFGEVTFSSIHRTPTGLSHPSGILVFGDAGLDVRFLRMEEFFASAQVGPELGYFGGVSGLENGVALLLGLRGGVRLSPGVSFTLSPQVAFGNAGSRVYFLHAGIDFTF
jgi:hypothetical protein